MKAGQTLLFSFASPASLPSWKNGTFGGRCLSCRVYAAQPIRWGSRTRSVIGHFGKTKATTRAFPSGCWADFGYFCRGGPAVGSATPSTPWSQKGPFVKRDSRDSWSASLRDRADNRIPSVY